MIADKSVDGGLTSTLSCRRLATSRPSYSLNRAADVAFNLWLRENALQVADSRYLLAYMFHILKTKSLCGREVGRLGDSDILGSRKLEEEDLLRFELLHDVITMHSCLGIEVY